MIPTKTPYPVQNILASPCSSIYSASLYKKLPLRLCLYNFLRALCASAQNTSFAFLRFSPHNFLCALRSRYLSGSARNTSFASSLPISIGIYAKHILALFFVLSQAFAIAQTPTPAWQWAKRCGSWGDNIQQTSGDESFSDVKVDKAGNVYAVGLFYANTAFQNAQLFGQLTPLGYGAEDAYLMKYNSCGSLLWYRRMGGTNSDAASSLVIDNTGKIVVLGYTASTPAQFSGGANTFTTNGGPQFIAKFDTAGTILAVNTYSTYYTKILLRNQGDFLLWEGINAAIVNTLGAITSTMTFANPTPFTPGIVGFALDKNDNIYLSGSFDNTISIGTGTLLTPTSSTLFSNAYAENSLVMKFSPTGTCLWYSRGYSAVADKLLGCVIDSSGNTLIAGGLAWNNSTVFSYLVNGGMSSAANPIYFFQAANGTLNSAITGSLSLQGAISPQTIDHDNSIYFAGSTNGLIAFNSNTYTSSSSGIWQSCIGKFDAGNNFLWLNMLPQSGSNSNKEQIMAMDLSQQGNLYLAGMFAGILDSAGTAVHVVGGSEDGFVAKFGLPCSSTLSLLSPLAPSSLTAAYQGSLTNLVNWVDNSNYESAYELWAQGGTITSFSLIATLPPNTTTYTHTGLSYTTTYCYEVRALNNIGPSVYTNSACVTTPAMVAPNAPANLAALNTGSLLNTVSWVDNSFDETTFELWYHDASPTFSLLATLPANTTTYTHTGLTYTTTYCYKAVATNSVGSSAFTNTDCATTPQQPAPNAPSVLTASNTAILTNNVNWLDNSNNETAFELWYNVAGSTFSLLATLPANTTTYTHTGLTYTTTYCYKAVATNSVGASAFTNTDCATTQAFNDVGIAKQSQNSGVSVYPNPSNGILNIDGLILNQSVTIKVLDALGSLKSVESRNLKSEPNIKIQLPSEPGIYFIEIHQQEKSNVYKVIKQ